MAKAGTQHEAAQAPRSYAKRMCDNVAIALVIYTLMLIFVTARAMHSSTSIFPYFVLVGFVAVAIPFLRNLERKWQALDKSELGTSGLDTRFTMDRVKLWMCAIVIPILLYFVIHALAAAF